MSLCAQKFYNAIVKENAVYRKKSVKRNIVLYMQITIDTTLFTLSTIIAHWSYLLC